MKFKSLSLKPEIVSALNKIGFEEATEVQEKTIPLILKGKDVVVRSQTGSGKTFAFILPILNNIDFSSKSIQALIVCPTRELALQAKAEVDKLAKDFYGLKVVAIYGGSDISRQISQLKSKPQIVIGTPGRLIDHINRRTLKLHEISTLVLDEADEMLNMGFKEDIESILKHTPSQRQTLMFSATYPADILNIVNNYQKDAVKIEIGQENKSLENIKQYYFNVDKNEKLDAIMKIFSSLKPNRAIIFTNTKIMAQNLSDFLNRNGYFSQSLHGDLRQSTRKKVINEIKTNKVDILVASDVAARGIDIADIDYVINFDLPYNVEYFLHRIGRTARAGKKGNAVSIVTSKGQLRTLKDYELETNSVMSELLLGQNQFKTSSDKKSSSSKRNPLSNREKSSLKSKSPRERKNESADKNEFKNSDTRKRFGRKCSNDKNENSGFRQNSRTRNDRNTKTDGMKRNFERPRKIEIFKTFENFEEDDYSNEFKSDKPRNRNNFSSKENSAKFSREKTSRFSRDNKTKSFKDDFSPRKRERKNSEQSDSFSPRNRERRNNEFSDKFSEFKKPRENRFNSKKNDETNFSDRRAKFDRPNSDKFQKSRPAKRDYSKNSDNSFNNRDDNFKSKDGRKKRVEKDNNFGATFSKENGFKKEKSSFGRKPKTSGKSSSFAKKGTGIKRNNTSSKSRKGKR